MLKRVYFDHNATTPPHSSVLAGMNEWAKVWGNPSSIHWAGRMAKALVREARDHVAGMLGVDPLEIIFTSGGSEANNLAIQGVLPIPCIGPRNEILVSSVEHPSVLKTVAAMERLGYRVFKIPVNRSGEIDFEYYRQKLNERTALVSIMWANNETGHIFPIRKLVKDAHAVGALFHCDMVQAFGKSPVDLKDLSVDLASFSGHKFYALKGSGFLFVRKGIQMSRQIHGGAQERGRRAGTENVLAIASLGCMAKMSDEILANADRVRGLRDMLEKQVQARMRGVTVTGSKGVRLPNTSHLMFDEIDGESLLMNLDLLGIAASSGAACSSGSAEPSPVLLAMGFSPWEAQMTLRLSLGWSNTEEDVFYFVERLVSTVERLRALRSETYGAADGNI